MRAKILRCSFLLLAALSYVLGYVCLEGVLWPQNFSSVTGALLIDAKGVAGFDARKLEIGFHYSGGTYVAYYLGAESGGIHRFVLRGKMVKAWRVHILSPLVRPIEDPQPKIIEIGTLCGGARIVEVDFGLR